MNPIVNMRQMRLLDRGVIRAVNAQGELGRRIRDMGLVPGAEIRVVGRAPLRDPVALRLRGCTLTLRNSEADHISVEIFPDDRPGPGYDVSGENRPDHEGPEHAGRHRHGACRISSQRTLNDLRDGETGIVAGLARPHCLHTGRLMAMGFIPGTEIRMLSGARETLMVQIQSSHVCLSRSMAQVILVDEKASLETESVLSK